ncbi:MAG: 30S ribosomal protein S7 [Dehalococcoidia bacterium SM23_28_2]|nr:MAG: 30S ribosomal protein S7 [Dehalococcoidia bacterium SM23_28_2]
MPRRGKVIRRRPAPDAKYNSVWLQMFINKLMRDGKKSTAERIIYNTLDIVEQRTRRNPVEVFEQAIRNAMPILEVRPRRVGGATYQIPLEVRPERQMSLAMRWLLMAVRGRTGRPIAERLAAELMDAASGQGVTIKRRDDTHRMAEANRAFAHYRW